MIQGITDYHRPMKEEVELIICDNCNLDFLEKDVRLSKMTGEHYCSKGENSCWREMSQKHKEQNKEFGLPKTSFE
jgi:hypothetical protein